MKNITAEFYCNVKELVAGSDDFYIGVDFKDNLVLLTSQKRKKMYYHDIYHLLDRETVHIKLPAIKRILSYAQPLGENWLLVDARIDEEENDVKNAFVFNKAGNLLNSFAFGDAVEDVQTTSKGDIWVSYFDQSDVGRLKCYKNGVETFDYYYSIRRNNPSVPPIDDCYAMNITPESTNIYYYYDFPFVKITGENEYELYEEIPIAGSNAFAIHGNNVLFNHDYDDKPEVYLYALIDKKKVTFQTLKPDGSLLNYDRAVGRGTKLFLIEDAEVYVLDIKDVLSR